MYPYRPCGLYNYLNRQEIDSLQEEYEQNSTYTVHLINEMWEHSNKEFAGVGMFK